MIVQQPHCHLDTSSSKARLILSGLWTLDYHPEMTNLLNALKLNVQNLTAVFDDKGRADTYGLEILARFFRDKKIKLTIEGLHPQEIKAFEQFCKPTETSVINVKTEESFALLEEIGKSIVGLVKTMYAVCEFLGYVVSSWMNELRYPHTFRFKTFWHTVEETGLRAMPIMGLIAFLIGIVTIYQGAQQLERFGAQIFTVNLLGVSLLREMGILLTAILVAGRSGSAFTAQIGFMKLNQEIDAMKVMGLNPFDLLIIPRIAALVVVLPMLTLFTNIVAILGGGFMSLTLLDLSWQQFFLQLQSAVEPWTFWTGMIKAPFFGFVIAMIACEEGMRVTQGAEDVGRRTTRSVVRSIFLIIVLDAIFSILYAELGV